MGRELREGVIAVECICEER